MESVFREFMLAIDRVQSDVLNASVSRTVMTPAHVAQVKNKGDALVAYVRQHPTELERFVKTHMREFQSCKRVLVGKLATSMGHVLPLEVTKAMTKTYNTVNEAMNFTRTFRELVRETTRVYTEFVKGITYFDWEAQPLRHPVYHRNASCGTTRRPSDVKFAKTAFGPDAAPYVRRCVLERLIYDRLYTHNIGFQDVGHRYELWQMGKIFDEYFPDHHVSVDLTYEPAPHGHVPRSVTIDLEVRGVLVHTWTYTRKYLEDIGTYAEEIQVRDIDETDGRVRYGTQTFSSTPLFSSMLLLDGRADVVFAGRSAHA